MSEILQALLARAGSYRGEGTNHEQQTFIGRFDLRSVVEDRGVCIEFTATGVDDDEVYHREFTLVAPGADSTLDMVTLSNNAPSTLTLELRRAGEEEGSERTIVFGIGAPEASDTLRMEVALDLWPGGELTYRFSWGLPGGEYAPRSSVRMKLDLQDLAFPS